MVILVAIGAEGVLQCASVSILMAGGAGDRRMLSLKRESGGSMVEVTCIFDLMERSFRMALLAVLSELVLVHIPVTVHATFMHNPLEYLCFNSISAPGRMAFGTFHNLVFAKQLEAGVVVLEPGCRTEFVVSMAGSTIRTQVPLVKVCVTIRTLLSQPQVGTGTFP